MGLGRKVRSFVEDFKVILVILFVPLIIVLFRYVLFLSYALTGGALLGVVLIFSLLFVLGLLFKPASLRRRV
ncbi:hypothetical protein [Thermococcus profundus]|uniref:hypothetical protein n=1 Tax=Thermococcus profundus TaxID=49899 RepID=UPI0012FDB80D|nr:hypothetical protein [Thermococcus profundus]